MVWLLPKSFPVSGYLLLSGLLFFHTIFSDFLVATVQKGHPAIEADWSFGDTLYLRSFSLKPIALTAPQHALFFVFPDFLSGDSTRASVGALEIKKATIGSLLLFRLYGFATHGGVFFYSVRRIEPSKWGMEMDRNWTIYRGLWALSDAVWDSGPMN